MNCIPVTVVIIRWGLEHIYKQRNDLDELKKSLKTWFYYFEHSCIWMLRYTKILRAQIKDNILIYKMFWIKNK